MFDCDETARILSAESLEQLTSARDSELKLIKKLRLVLNALQHQRLRDINLSDVKPLEYALKVLQVGEYLRLTQKDDDWLLDLHDLRRTVSFSYTERKAVRHYLAEDLQKRLRPIVEFGQRMRTELPEVFAAPMSESTLTVTLNSCSPSTPQTLKAQILSLEAQRRNNMQKLVVLRNRKCGYMKAAAELKMGPYLGHELELMYAQARHNQIKSDVLRSYFINEFATRTEHSLKALKEVIGYVDSQLEQTEEK